MNLILSSVLESAFLVIALSLDALVASFAYGAKKIEIPFRSAAVIDLICTGILAATLLIGSFFSPFVSSGLTNTLCFSILFFLGLVKLFDSILKNYINRTNVNSQQIKFRMFNLKFILSIYADPEKADVDCSSTLSPSESAALAVALSLDGAAVGFGAGLDDFNFILILVFSIIFNLAAVYAGCWMGRRISAKTPRDFSWFSGIILIILALTKLL